MIRATHLYRHAFLGLLVTGCHVIGFTTPPHMLEPATSSDDQAIHLAEAGTNDEVRTVATLVNRRRRALGRRPLVWDERLARIAERHSRDMARRGFFSHVNPSGRDPFERMENEGLRFRAAAENIAEGQVSAREVYEGWMRSRGHRTNLESRTYTHHGIGLYRNRWTHLFARY